MNIHLTNEKVTYQTPFYVDIFLSPKFQNKKGSNFQYNLCHCRQNMAGFSINQAFCPENEFHITHTIWCKNLSVPVVFSAGYLFLESILFKGPLHTLPYKVCVNYRIYTYFGLKFLFQEHFCPKNVKM